MKLIKQNEIDKAAYSFNPVKKLDAEFMRSAFKTGVSYAESKIENISIDFADWIDKCGYIKEDDKWAYWNEGI